ncbi:MAG: amidase [Actinomycetota bacterium]|nr:amidase [Actinomycetota bacterium]
MHEGIFLAQPSLAPAVGIRLAVKDLFDTAGLTTTYGSIIFVDHVPTETAKAVRQLEASGYVNVGKTNLHEFAYGVTSENPHFGTVPNPISPGRIAGGSSGGSAAAVAAGLADVGLGTDSGGSIRIPAACCGVVGFKPTYGRVPVDGCFPLAPGFDHVGPIARCVADCEAMVDALVPEHTPTAVPGARDLRVALAWLEDAAPLVRRRVEEAAHHFTHTEVVDFPRERGVGPAFMRDVASVHKTLFEEQRESYGEDVARKLERCLAVGEREYEQAVAARRRLEDEALETVRGFDLLLTPTVPVVAPKARRAEDDERRSVLTRNTFTINALGWPALALPCGLAEDDLPASVQLVAPRGEDALVLAAGTLLERSLSPI